MLAFVLYVGYGVSVSRSTPHRRAVVAEANAPVFLEGR